MTDFSALLQPDRGQPARDVHVVHPDRFADWLAGQPVRVRTAIAANKVTGRAGGDWRRSWAISSIAATPTPSSPAPGPVGVLS